MTKRIGLIAGNRKFPLLFCAGAKRQGYSVVAVAIKGETSPLINLAAEKVYWLRLTEFKRMFEIFKSEGLQEVAMAGQISPRHLFRREVLSSPDIREVLASMIDKKADTIFSAIADKLKYAGLNLLDSTLFIKDFLPSKGLLTVNKPDTYLWEEIYFGLELAKGVSALDIGQTVAVKHKVIVAVEALEGTDNLILRAGRLARGGITVVKVAKPKQDMRFDIPVVGLNTVKKLIRAGAKCLAIEADKTLFIDREASVRLAERKGIVIVAV